MKKMNRNKLKKVGLISFVMLTLGMTLYLMIADSFLDDLKYNDFWNHLNHHNIEKIMIVDNEPDFIAVLKNGEKYRVSNPKNDTFIEDVLKNDVKVEGRFRISMTTISLLISMMSCLMILKFLLNRGSNRLTSMAVHKVDIDTQISYDDISCNPEIKKELLRIVDFLKRPEYYQERKAKMPNGILLYGPPGTGKTLLAKATAQAANCAFYALSGSDFVEMYVGRGASRVRDLFKEARAHAPAIIFIDEIDAIGKKRGHDSNSEKDQTINALLNELDGFKPSDNVIVIAATNDLKAMDKALTRSGRFGKHIMVPLPASKEERRKIIDIHKVDNAYDDSVDFDLFAKKTTGFSGADIASILNEALLISIEEGKSKVDSKDLDKAFHQHLFEGHQNERKNKISEQEQKAIAYHEAGHALIANVLCKEDVTSISVIGTTTGAGGYTISTPEEERYMETKTSLEYRIMKLYAGRAAEEVGGFQLSVGAHDDIRRASELLVLMYNEFAMMDDAMINFDVLNKHHIKTDDVSEQIKTYSKALYQQAKSFLNKHKQLLDELANTLLEKETLTQDEVETIILKYI